MRKSAMATRKKPKVNADIRTRAREVLAFAEVRARTARDAAEFSNSLFAPGGRAIELFPTQPERAAFFRTPEYRRILALKATLPSPPVRGTIELVPVTNGTIVLHVPQSIHNALVEEARAEGVSLENLCLSKLVAPLRSVV
jgi:hypothetical protein